MISVKSFTFSPFDENTYILYDETKECIIIDPGCYSRAEQLELSDFIEKNALKPVKLISTHCHLDHVFGNAYVVDTYKIPYEIHQGELPVLASFMDVCKLYGIPVRGNSPSPTGFIAEGEEVLFGNSKLSVIFTPGHSPASLSFYSEVDKFVIAGDVLFYDSIGRTDLPGGDFDTLIESIRTQLFPLGDDVTVYNGHGQPTTIGRERKYNPFLVN
jgi:hydroxyacylglutathione hydrolase